MRTSLSSCTQRCSAVVGCAALTLVALAAPASAHASFPSSLAFGFAPNTSGGSGATNVAPPYTAGSTNVIFLRAPFEQTTPFNGLDDTNVDVKAVVPAGWTAPVCGTAKTNVNDTSTSSTNQPGPDVTGWTCEIVTVDGHQVVHFFGPQISTGQTKADSAQFFSFSVTAPAPEVQTSYNGTGGTEGFIVDQAYASGAAKHWIPNAAYTGTAPAGSTTVVATGLVRTVAAAPVPEPTPTTEPTATPTPTETPTTEPTATPTPTETATPEPTATAAPAAVPAHLTSVSPRTLTAGQTLTVTASATPGQLVDLVLRPTAGPAYQVVRTARVPESGTVSWSGLKPGTNSVVAVRQRGTGSTSGGVKVQVRSALSLTADPTSRAGRWTLSGTVAPHRACQVVTLFQVNADGSRLRLGAVSSDRSGHYALTYAFGSAARRTLVAVTGADSTNAAGTSALLVRRTV